MIKKLKTYILFLFLEEELIPRSWPIKRKGENLIWGCKAGLSCDTKVAGLFLLKGRFN